MWIGGRQGDRRYKAEAKRDEIEEAAEERGGRQRDRDDRRQAKK